jgi:phosphopantothenate-cysteine ligase
MGQERRTDSGPLRILVTGGGTVAPIDDVRQIRNLSTGRFSAQITEALLDRHAEVWHVFAPNAQQPLKRLAQFDLSAPEPEHELLRLRRLRDRWADQHHQLHLVPLEHGTVADYAATVRTILTHTLFDAALLAMAVSDYEPVPNPGKLESVSDELILHCHRTPKVIRSIRDWAPDVFLVGFKLLAGAEPHELAAVALEACRVNQADLTVANDLTTLRAGRHTIHVVDAAGAVRTLGPEPPPAPGLADLVLDLVHARRSA